MLAKAFWKIRKSLGLTQTQMGERLGVGYVTICLIETGKRFPSWKLIERCEKEFGINPYIYAWCISEPKEFEKEAKQLQEALTKELIDD